MEKLFIPFHNQIELFLFQFPYNNNNEKLLLKIQENLKIFIYKIQNDPKIKFYLPFDILMNAEKCLSEINIYLETKSSDNYHQAYELYNKFSESYLKALNGVRKIEGLKKYDYNYRKHNNLFSCKPRYFWIDFHIDMIYKFIFKISMVYLKFVFIISIIYILSILILAILTIIK